MDVWIETTANGLLNLMRMIQIKVGSSLHSATPAQLELYLGPSEFLILAEGTPAAMAAHYTWIRGIIAADKSGIYTRPGL